MEKINQYFEIWLKWYISQIVPKDENVVCFIHPDMMCEVQYVWFY